MGHAEPGLETGQRGPLPPSCAASPGLGTSRSGCVSRKQLQAAPGHPGRSSWGGDAEALARFLPPSPRSQAGSWGLPYLGRPSAGMGRGLRAAPEGPYLDESLQPGAQGEGAGEPRASWEGGGCRGEGSRPLPGSPPSEGLRAQCRGHPESRHLGICRSELRSQDGTQRPSVEPLGAWPVSPVPCVPPALTLQTGGGSGQPVPGACREARLPPPPWGGGFACPAWSRRGQ